MAVEIKVPALGESVTEATVAKWLVKAGDSVSIDQPLCELETDKVTVEVNATLAGTIVALSGLAYDNPNRTLWEAAAAVPFTAYCAAATQINATSATASGYRVMGLPGTAPGGYKRFSYGRKLSRERTKRGYLP